MYIKKSNDLFIIFISLNYNRFYEISSRNNNSK